MKGFFSSFATPTSCSTSRNSSSSSSSWIKFICAVFAFLLYVNTVEYGFVYDDHRAILTNDDLLPSTPIFTLLEHDFWGRPVWHAGSHKSYRPLAVLSLRLNDALAGGTLHPAPLHLGNAVLHAAVTALLTHLAAVLLLEDLLGDVESNSCSNRGGGGTSMPNDCRDSESMAGMQASPKHSNHQRKIQEVRPASKSLSATPTHQRRRTHSWSSSLSSTQLPRSGGPGFTSSQGGQSSSFCTSAGVFFTGILFASHPVHTEAVCGLVGRADIGATLFSLLAILAYRKHAKVRDSSSSYSATMSLCASVIFGVGAMLFKEHGLAALPLCAVYDALVHCRCRPIVRVFNWGLHLKRTSSAPSHLLRAQKKADIQPEMSPAKLFKKVKTPLEDGDRGFYQSLVFIIIAISSLLVLRCLALAGGLPTFSSSDNPASRSTSILTRTLTFFYLPVLNLKLLICPTTLSFDWSMDAVPLIRSMADARNIASVATYAGFAYILAKLIHSTSAFLPLKEVLNICKSRIFGFTKVQHKHIISGNSGKVFLQSTISLFAISMIVLPFLPATNLIAYVGFVVAERVLYAPSMGYCLLLGIGLSNLLKATMLPMPRGWNQFLRIVLLSCAFLLVIIFTAKTINRSEDWRDEENLYRSGISINPAKAYGNLGNVLSNRGRIDEAEKAYREALVHRPNMADAHFNLGLLLQNKGELQEAIDCYKRAIQFRPSLAVAHLNMGLTLVRMGNWEEGIKRLRLLAERGGEKIGDSSILKDPKAHEVALASSRFHLGRLLAQHGHLHEALEILHDAVQRMPPHYSPQSLLNMLGEVYRQMGREDEAEEWFRASLQSKPDHIPAHLTYARLLADNKTRIPEAEKQYLKALEIAPRDVSVLHQYGRFLVEQGRHVEAAELFRSATEILDPPHFEDVMAAATSYRLSGNLHKAEMFYRRGVQLRPQLHSAHVNLGALLHLIGQLEEAKECYKKALFLKPGDELTTTNLQRLQATMTSQSSNFLMNSSKQTSTSKNGIG